MRGTQWQVQKMHDTLCNAKASELEMQDLVHMSDTCKAESNHEIIMRDACDKHSVQECKDCMDNLTAGGDKVRIKPQAKWHLLSRLELPDWLRGNPFLSHYHRPPMPSFGFCFKSIFKMHTETGNIWTHLIGFIAFVSIALYMFFRPISASSPFPKDWQEKLVFGIFFACGIICLGFSWIFHTVHCHSKTVSTIFRR